MASTHVKIKANTFDLDTWALCSLSPAYKSKFNAYHLPLFSLFQSKRSSLFLKRSRSFPTQVFAHVISFVGNAHSSIFYLVNFYSFLNYWSSFSYHKEKRSNQKVTSTNFHYLIYLTTLICSHLYSFSPALKSNSLGSYLRPVVPLEHWIPPPLTCLKNLFWNYTLSSSFFHTLCLLLSSYKYAVTFPIKKHSSLDSICCSNYYSIFDSLYNNTSWKGCPNLKTPPPHSL